MKVPIYPEHIADLIRSPKFSGEIEDPNAVGTEAKFDCGCFVRFEMSIDEGAGVIDNVRYRTNGCGFMAAAAEKLAGSVTGRPLTELGASFDPSLERNANRKECYSTAVNALVSSFSDYRARRIEEFRGEKPLICTCFGVSEETVEEFVQIRKPTDVFQVTSEIRAGSGCGSCRMLIQEIIDTNA